MEDPDLDCLRVVLADVLREVFGVGVRWDVDF